MGHGRVVAWLTACLLTLALAACGVGTVPVPTAGSPTPPILPTPTLAVPTAVPTPTTPRDSGWISVAEGLDLRQVPVLGADGRLLEQVTAVRLDPAHYTFRVGYRPGAPQSLADWQAQTEALLVVNGGFFTPEFTATGLLVTDGVVSGVSYEGFGGMFAVTDAGPEVWGLATRPYTPELSVTQGVQAFPMLVDGGAAAYTDAGDLPARRTAVGMDGNGRVLFIVAERGHFGLADFSRFLAESDLGLTVALNLDGAGSTGLVVQPALQQRPLVEIPAFTHLPVVIMASSK